jgi:hypothetical protein
MLAAIHQPQYWPGLRFFSKMRAADLFILLDDVQYERREFQNRNRLRTAKGWQYLTAPVLAKGRFDQLISEVRLDPGAGWRREHLAAIKCNYARAKYFREYLPALERLYAADYEYLQELALATADLLRGAFGIKTPLRRASEFAVDARSSERLARLCAAAGAETYLSGAGARAYLDAGVFGRAGVKLAWQEFEVKPYPQAFPGFEKDLSALDLLLNCGPDSVQYL